MDKTASHLLTHSILFLLPQLVQAGVIATVFCNIFNHLRHKWVTDHPGPFRISYHLLLQFPLGLWTINYIAQTQNDHSPQSQQLHIV